MHLDESLEGIERHADGADRVGYGRQRNRRALERTARGLPVQRLVRPNFSSTMIASRLGPAQPRGITWNGAAPG
jgi:hypothetical protein